MTTDLGDLYQEVILDHNRRPRNFGKLETADRQAVGYNPLCGDHLTVYLEFDGDVIRRVTFQGSGCALSKASASMMTEALAGKTRAEADALFRRFHRMVTGEEGSEASGAPPLGKLSAFSGVSEFPARVKCASLAWHTMMTALEGKEETVSTE